MDRREFLTAAGGTVLAIGAWGWGVDSLTTRLSDREGMTSERKSRNWGMLIDLTRCKKKPGCSACTEACRTENNVALFTKPDMTPEQRAETEQWDNHWIRKVTIKSKAYEDAPPETVILVCNHCEEPPCAQVCPVQATFKREDGIVLVDHHRCIGCRYCVMSCPYNARLFNWKHNDHWPNKQYPNRSHGVAESCHLCAHLLDRDQEPACVRACAEEGASALAVGDLNNRTGPDWYPKPPKEGPRLTDTEHTPKRLREDLGTEPKVYYYGLP